MSSWEVGLSSCTERVLRWWIKQGKERENHNISGKMWLNNAGNPYNPGNLNYLLRKLIEIAAIDRNGRKINWYPIRRSTGVYLRTSIVSRTPKNNFAINRCNQPLGMLKSRLKSGSRYLMSCRAAFHLTRVERIQRCWVRGSPLTQRTLHRVFLAVRGAFAFISASWVQRLGRILSRNVRQRPIVRVVGLSENGHENLGDRLGHIP